MDSVSSSPLLSTSQNAPPAPLKTIRPDNAPSPDPFTPAVNRKTLSFPEFHLLEMQSTQYLVLDCLAKPIRWIGGRVTCWVRLIFQPKTKIRKRRSTWTTSEEVIKRDPTYQSKGVKAKDRACFSPSRLKKTLFQNRRSLNLSEAV